MGFISQHLAKLRPAKKGFCKRAIQTNNEIGGGVKVSNRRGEREVG
jgi:hypothetical protein